MRKAIELGYTDTVAARSRNCIALPKAANNAGMASYVTHNIRLYSFYDILQEDHVTEPYNQMSRRPQQSAESVTRNQQALKNLVKIESNKSCADCKRNKRWSSLALFSCLVRPLADIRVL